MRLSPGVAVAIPFALLASGCPLLRTYSQKPRIKLTRVDVVQVVFTGAKLAAELDVENRIPSAITVGRIHWSVSVDGTALAGGDIANGISIAANAHAPVTVPFEVKFADLYKIGDKYKDADVAPYHLEGTMELDTPLGPLSIPFHHDGTVPVLKVPEVDLARVEARGVGFSGADVRLSFHVKNPNNLALGVQTLDYQVTLAGARLANGHLPTPLDLQPKSTGAFEADVHVSFSDAAQAAQSLAGRNSAEYSIGGNIAAKTPWGVVDTPFERAGTVKISR